MFPGFLLALREGIEAALIIGMLFGALRRLQHPELSASVWWGVASAGAVSLLVAGGLQIAGAELEGPAEPIFEGVTMFLAAGLLTWMIFWMHGQSRHLKGRIENNIRQALGQADFGATRRGLFGVAFLAVVREGIEMALFLVAAGLVTKSVESLVGAGLGLAGAFAFGWVMFSSTRRLPLNTFFKVTNVLLVLFAAGLFAHGVGEFNEVGLIPAVIAPVYNLNPLLPETSVVGQILQALFGYTGSPSLTQLLAYLLYFAVLVLTLFRLQRMTSAQGIKSQA